jgi:hypothetical protein
LITPTNKDDRGSIQDYFSVTYGLEVSVRPSFSNALYGDLHTKLFHAQVQTGKLSLPGHAKNEKENWMQKYLSIS